MVSQRPTGFQRALGGKADFIEYIDALRRPEIWAASGWMFSQDNSIAKLDVVRNFVTAPRISATPTMIAPRLWLL